MASHNTDANCIFCKIIKGDIPSFKLIETENVYVALCPLVSCVRLTFAFCAATRSLISVRPLPLSRRGRVVCL